MRPRAETLPFVLALAVPAHAQSDAPSPPTTAEVLEASPASDWRPLDPGRTLYLELGAGRVVIELAPAFAPRHVANIQSLAKAGYFDGLAILRSQDNYVVQWGDPKAGEPEARSLGDAARTLPPEFDREAGAEAPFTPLPDGDVYAPEVGFVDGFPAARDAASGRVWLAHCYGMVGVGRDNTVDSGSGAELYVVTGHAPRHLDRNVTLVGRVVDGMERLSTLPRGGGPLGFYETAEERVPVERVRIAAEVPEAERTPLERLRTDTATFRALVRSRRVRQEEWFATSPGKVGLCNVPLPVRRVSPR
jgi:peptidylprolyl isomerase